ncbi:Transposase domain [Variovorax sp. CF079]|nr:Transposase domain [Variovorax sp. CF079]
MKQLGLGLNLSTKKTRKREFLEEMERVVPWAALVQIVEPHCPRAKTGRPPMPVETMLRIHYLQQWFGLSDPAVEEALHDVPLYPRDECVRCAANAREAASSRLAQQPSERESTLRVACLRFMFDQWQSRCAFCRPSLMIAYPDSDATRA